MENASKALIIAGAILVSILLISLGIVMFNSSKGTTDQSSNTMEALNESASGKVQDIRQNLGLGTR